jgi:hypothetical protein
MAIPCGGGLEYSTVALRAVRGDEKRFECLVVYLGHPVHGGYKYGDLAFHVVGVSNLRLRLAMCLAGLGTEIDCVGKSQQQL